MVWTTNDKNHPYDVAEDGYGYTPLNKFGGHYWMLDVDIDCSDGVPVQVDHDNNPQTPEITEYWFELKSYISNGPGWEKNIKQSGAPYDS